DSGLLFGCERHRRFIIGIGQPENNTSDVVLSLRRKAASSGERLIEKFCHWSLGSKIPRRESGYCHTPSRKANLELASKTTFGIVGGQFRLDLLVGQPVGARRAFDRGKIAAIGSSPEDCGRSMLLTSFPMRSRRPRSPSASAASGVTGISTITVAAISRLISAVPDHI